ncbi:MAG TPA: FtsX-like permease family protein, partial [Puia sp.]|nr:FtsX-like permease family protein [Puia sp.]
ETSFDDFHRAKERIFRVLTEYHHSKDHETFYGAEVPMPLPAIIKTDLPDLENSAGVFGSSGDQLFVLDANGQVIKKFREKSGVFAMEPAFFEIFNFPWLSGDPQTSLKEPNSIVLSKETATRYFGDWRKAIGGTIKMNNILLLKVTGILATIPANTDFQIKAVIPFRILGISRSSDWSNASNKFGCYVKLPPNTSAAAFTSRLRDLSKKYRPAGNTDELVLQPIGEIHFYDNHNHIANFLGRSVSRDLIRILWIIAAFILVIACINFINLSTAQAVRRAKEIGVRKVLGGRGIQLQTQFLTETFLLVSVSVLLAVLVAAFTIAPVGRLLDLPLSPSIFFEPAAAVFLFGVILVTTFVAGYYPSVVLAAFNPIKALKGKLSANGSKSLSLRRALVVLQFVIAQGIIIVMLVFIKQMDYFRNGNMGFDKDAIVEVRMPMSPSSQIDYLRNSLESIPGVRGVSFNSNAPADDDNNWGDIYREPRSQAQSPLFAISKYADPEYLNTYGLKLEAGRNFSSDSAHEFLITRKTLETLGFRRPEDALNKEMSTGDNFIKGPIVGVLSDFHSTGFKDQYSPVFITPHIRLYRMAGIKLSPMNMSVSMSAIEALWEKTFPDFLFEYQFLDDAIAGFYKEENRQTQLYKIVAGIAIFLGCLGLYGLISFMAAQRRKEVGIRKVLGASTSGITYLFLKEFLVLIVVAFLIASPISGYLMNRWLEDYAYRIHLNWWIFLLSGAATVVITLLTISYTAIRAALANPVNVLRAD